MCGTVHQVAALAACGHVRASLSSSRVFSREWPPQVSPYCRHTEAAPS